MTDLTDRDHSELLMLYQVTIEDIEKAKQWGWTISYSTIAAQGGILGLFAAYGASHTSGIHLGVKMLFAALAVGLLVLGLNHIKYAQRSLVAFRDRLKNVRGNFGKPFEACFGQPYTKPMWPLEIVVLATTAVVVVLLFL